MPAERDDQRFLVGAGDPNRDLEPANRQYADAGHLDVAAGI